MKSATLAEIRSDFDTFLKESKTGPVVVLNKGKPVGVLIAVRNEDEMERLLLAHSPRLQAILKKSEAQIDAGKGIPHEECWAMVEKENNKGKPGPVKKNGNGRRRSPKEPSSKV
jgi:prevent-host-death family protein